MYSSDRFDCSDYCHLAWLIRDNRHLLQFVPFGTCSYGTQFEDLDPNRFTDCPVIILHLILILIAQMFKWFYYNNL